MEAFRRQLAHEIRAPEEEFLITITIHRQPTSAAPPPANLTRASEIFGITFVEAAGRLTDTIVPLDAPSPPPPPTPWPPEPSPPPLPPPHWPPPSPGTPPIAGADLEAQTIENSGGGLSTGWWVIGLGMALTAGATGSAAWRAWRRRQRQTPTDGWGGRRGAPFGMLPIAAEAGGTSPITKLAASALGLPSAKQGAGPACDHAGGSQSHHRCLTVAARSQRTPPPESAAWEPGSAEGGRGVGAAHCGAAAAAAATAAARSSASVGGGCPRGSQAHCDHCDHCDRVVSRGPSTTTTVVSRRIIDEIASREGADSDAALEGDSLVTCSLPAAAVPARSVDVPASVVALRAAMAQTAAGGIRGCPPPDPRASAVRIPSYLKPTRSSTHKVGMLPAPPAPQPQHIAWPQPITPNSGERGSEGGCTWGVADATGSCRWRRTALGAQGATSPRPPSTSMQAVLAAFQQRHPHARAIRILPNQRGTEEQHAADPPGREEAGAALRPGLCAGAQAAQSVVAMQETHALPAALGSPQPVALVGASRGQIDPNTGQVWEQMDDAVATHHPHHDPDASAS